jgi:Beta-ketoacyl synthase, N-terminal domain
VKTPALTSPTKFHNSVHNAAAGYWTIATGCMKPYTALCGRDCTFGQGLLEAAAQALAENSPVLFVAYDIESRGPISTMQPSRGVLAGALVLSPEKSSRHVARVVLDIRADSEPRQSTARAENAALVHGNALANALPLFEALAAGVESRISQILAPTLALDIRVVPAGARGMESNLMNVAQ